VTAGAFEEMKLLRSSLALTSLLALGVVAPAFAQTAPPGPAALQSPAVPQAPASVIHDPWEKLNRVLYVGNGILDIAVIRPVSIFYKRVTPRPARDGVHNVLDNLGEPVVIINHALQLKPARAVAMTGRFALNSTLGIGGLFDVASGAGLPEQRTDFGQTLGRYGVGQGPYLFLIGPSTVRDSAGQLVDIFLDPFTYINYSGRTYFTASRAVLQTMDARYRADPTLRYIEKTSTDPYVVLRSAYLQNADFLAGGGKVNVKALPDFGSEPSAAPPAATPTTPN
jgi:phospholipid-binding lipoprotein MlaA